MMRVRFGLGEERMEEEHIAAGLHFLQEEEDSMTLLRS
jgi:hypothetical protein